MEVKEADTTPLSAFPIVTTHGNSSNPCFSTVLNLALTTVLLPSLRCLGLLGELHELPERSPRAQQQQHHCHFLRSSRTRVVRRGTLAAAAMVHHIGLRFTRSLRVHSRVQCCNLRARRSQAERCQQCVAIGALRAQPPGGDRGMTRATGCCMDRSGEGNERVLARTHCKPLHQIHKTADHVGPQARERKRRLPSRKIGLRGNGLLSFSCFLLVSSTSLDPMSRSVAICFGILATARAEQVCTFNWNPLNGFESCVDLLPPPVEHTSKFWGLMVALFLCTAVGGIVGWVVHSFTPCNTKPYIELTGWRRLLAEALESGDVLLVVVLVLFTDLAASAVTLAGGAELVGPATRVGFSCLVTILAEQMLHLLAFGDQFFSHPWFVMDLIVISISAAADLTEELGKELKLLMIWRLWKIFAWVFNAALVSHEFGDLVEMSDGEMSDY